MIGNFFKKRLSQRVLFEDALKHIHHCQSRGNEATFESLEGGLKLSAKKVVRLIERLEKRRLVTISGNGIRLTPTGEAWALQVIRAHRIWESYLTDEVGVPLEKIHAEAEKKEHELTPEQINVLEEKLGYPNRDPHGDPIPGAKGDVKEPKGVSLLDWPAGKLARIVHIEDEPSSIFTQILAEGLILDTCLRVLDSGPKGLHIWTLLNDFWLAPIVAGNIFVDEAPSWFEEREVELAAALKVGERGKVLALNAQGLNRRRLMDLGLVPGTIIEAVMSSAFNDPIAFKVRGAMTALRQEQAKQIIIKRLSKEGNGDVSVS